MSGLVFYVVDVETTGLDSKYHECTEISIIRATDRVQLWRQIRCEYPERANYDSLKITNKTMADLSLGFDKSAVVRECEQFLAEDGLTPAHRCIIGHNVSFDRKFIHAMWGRQGVAFSANLWLDTMAMMRAWAKKNGLHKPKVNLQASMSLMGIQKFALAHSAKTDSRNTYLLHKELVENRQMDYLPFIKTAAHSLGHYEEEHGLDPSMLDTE